MVHNFRGIRSDILLIDKQAEIEDRGATKLSVVNPKEVSRLSPHVKNLVEASVRKEKVKFRKHNQAKRSSKFPRSIRQSVKITEKTLCAFTTGSAFALQWSDWTVVNAAVSSGEDKYY